MNRQRSIGRAMALMMALVTPTDLVAQGSWREVGHDLRVAYGDVVAVWASPVHFDTKDWLHLGGVFAVSAAVMPFDDDIDAWTTSHPRSLPMHVVRPFREEAGFPLAHLSKAIELLPLSAMLYIGGVASRSGDLQDAGLGCAAAQHANSMVRHLTGLVIARQRPRLANGDQQMWGIPGGEWERRSFPAGHAANAMSCVAFMNERFAMGIAEPMLLLIAIGAGGARIADRRHWMSDTVLGTLFGYAVGRTVALRSLEREAKREARPSRAPVGVAIGDWRVGTTGSLVQVGWGRTF
jgi:membrane-associated phospholipid phosphatase